MCANERLPNLAVQKLTATFNFEVTRLRSVISVAFVVDNNHARSSTNQLGLPLSLLLLIRDSFGRRWVTLLRFTTNLIGHGHSHPSGPASGQILHNMVAASSGLTAISIIINSIPEEG